MPPPSLPARTEEAAERFIERKPEPAAAAAPLPPVAAKATGKAVVNLRMDNALLNRIDREARKVGISRSAWLHVAAYEKLDRK
jgi:hypothetical protein